MTGLLITLIIAVALEAAAILYFANKLRNRNKED